MADGAFRNFLPAIDEHSITVKPFCDGADVLHMTGKKADVGPSEYVPASFGVFPPPLTLLEHLYELGYQDMETWLDHHLEERMRQVAGVAAEQAHAKASFPAHCKARQQETFGGCRRNSLAQPGLPTEFPGRPICRLLNSPARTTASFGTRRFCRESLSDGQKLVSTWVATTQTIA